MFLFISYSNNICINVISNKNIIKCILGNDEQNVILWMDHRASKEAETINKLHHQVLKFVGGKISLEMETPKLLWLKTNLKDCWSRTTHFFDLPDFLTWKATDCKSR